MIDPKIMAKTLFIAFPQIGPCLKLMERDINYRASTSFTSSQMTMDAEQLCAKLLDKIYAKNQLEAVQKTLIIAFKTLKADEFRIIRDIYMKEKSSAEVAAINGISRRTVFRRIAQTTEYFTKVLNGLGFTAKSFQDLIFSQKWIARIYREVKSKQEQTPTPPPKSYELVYKVDKTKTAI